MRARPADRANRRPIGSGGRLHGARPLGRGNVGVEGAGPGASGHVPPGHPDSLIDWSVLAQLQGTLVLMMAVERVAVFADALLAGGKPGDTPVAMIENGSLPTQRLLRTDLAHAGEVADAENLTPPAIVVVGAVAAFTDADSGSRR